MTFPGEWVYPGPVVAGQGYTYRYGFGDFSTPPNVTLDVYVDPQVDIDPSTGSELQISAGPMPPYWAASAYSIKSVTPDNLTASESELKAARIVVNPSQPTPTADTGPWPPDAVSVEYAGSGVYSGLFKVAVGWGVYGAVYPAVETATGRLARLPNGSEQSMLDALNAPGTWSVIDTLTDMSPNVVPSQNVIGATPGIEKTTIFETADTNIPLGVFTDANVGGHATPATAYVSGSRQWGWYADGARIFALTITRTYTPPAWRWIFADPVPIGQWRLRQRQSLTGSDSWPIRQRQNGAHSGSWPLRQRQTGM